MPSVVRPSKDIKILELNQYRKVDQTPSIIHEYLESLIKKVDGFKHNLAKSSKKKQVKIFLVETQCPRYGYLMDYLKYFNLQKSSTSIPNFQLRYFNFGLTFSHMAQWVRGLLRMHEIRSSTPRLVTGICDSNKSRARHRRSLMDHKIRMLCTKLKVA